MANEVSDGQTQREQSWHGYQMTEEMCDTARHTEDGTKARGSGAQKSARKAPKSANNSEKSGQKADTVQKRQKKAAKKRNRMERSGIGWGIQRI